MLLLSTLSPIPLLRASHATARASTGTSPHHFTPLLLCACVSPFLFAHRRQDRSFNLQFLKEEFDIGPEQIEALYQYAKFQFDCGNYSTASELLQVRTEGQQLQQ